MRIILATAVCCVGLAGPLAAQGQPEAAPPAPAATPPSGTPPAGTPPAGTPPAPAEAPAAKEVDPVVERQRKSAAKLAGMIRFVAVSCPEAQPDYDRFKSVIASMRIDIKELETGSLLGESLGYSRAYDKDKEESCRRVFEHFGENGTTIPNLVARKKAP